MPVVGPQAGKIDTDASTRTNTNLALRMRATNFLKAKPPVNRLHTAGHMSKVLLPIRTVKLFGRLHYRVSKVIVVGTRTAQKPYRIKKH